MKKTADGTTWNDHLASAMQALRLENLDLAENRLGKAFTAAENDVASLHLMAGRIALARGTLSKAEKAWHRALEIDQDKAETWNNLGVLYRRQGKPEKALLAFREAEKRAPNRPGIPYNIGNLCKAEQRFDEAITAYNHSIEIDPNYAPAYNNLGTLYERRKEWNTAKDVFRRGLSADKGDAALRFNLGLVYQEQEQWAEAKEAFDSALKSHPGWVPALNNLGIVLQEIGREHEATRTLKTLLEIEPNNVSALNNLGIANERLGRSEDAQHCFRKALDEDPKFTKAALNLHDSYRKSKEFNKALEELNKQVNHYPTNPDIRIRIAQTLIDLTQWEEAERSLNHVLERTPYHPKALQTKAELFLATSRPQEAEALLGRLTHDPDIVRDLARLNIDSERSESAERLLKELIAENPEDAESRRLMADLVSQDRPEEALRLREEAAVVAPDSPEDLISLAELYGRTGHKSQALGKLDEAVNLLGARGAAEDLDAMDAVLSLYENATVALEGEYGDLFLERTAQLGRKLKSAMGLSSFTPRQRDLIALDEIPLEEEDALSLLEINAMEPVISINEEEETIFLEESVEDLTDIYTELYEPDKPGNNQGPHTTGTAQIPNPLSYPNSPGNQIAPTSTIDQKNGNNQGAHTAGTAQIPNPLSYPNSPGRPMAPISTIDQKNGNNQGPHTAGAAQIPNPLSYPNSPGRPMAPTSTTDQKNEDNQGPHTAEMTQIPNPLSYPSSPGNQIAPTSTIDQKNGNNQGPHTARTAQIPNPLSYPNSPGRPMAPTSTTDQKNGNNQGPHTAEMTQIPNPLSYPDSPGRQMAPTSTTDQKNGNNQGPHTAEMTQIPNPLSYPNSPGRPMAPTSTIDQKNGNNQGPHTARTAQIPKPLSCPNSPGRPMAPTSTIDQKTRNPQPLYKPRRTPEGIAPTPLNRVEHGDSVQTSVQIHPPAQAMEKPSSHVIYQKVRSVQALPTPSPRANSPPMVSVEDLTEEPLSSLSKDDTDKNTKESRLDIVMAEKPVVVEITVNAEKVTMAENNADHDIGDVEDDEHPFLIPDSGALSEDLPETAPSDSDPLSRMGFPEDNKETTEYHEIIDDVSENWKSKLQGKQKREADQEVELAENVDKDAPAEILGPEKMAQLFGYLLGLTDKTTGEGRQKLINKGVPLMLASLHARLLGEPKFRDIARQHDRRSNERHNVCLNREKINGALGSFKSLADFLPANVVRDSLCSKLGKILSVVDKSKTSEKKSPMDE